MSRFKGLKAEVAARTTPPPAAASSSSTPTTTRAKARDGKRAVVGYFSEDLSRQLRMLAAEEGSTVQALVGEAIDLLLQARGKHTFGER
jgi:hypothetical protein